MQAIKIDYHKCTGCKRCYEICPEDIFIWDEETKMPRVARQDECWLCGICFMDCPKRAIDLIYPPSFW